MSDETFILSDLQISEIRNLILNAALPLYLVEYAIQMHIDTDILKSIKL